MGIGTVTIGEQLLEIEKYVPLLDEFSPAVSAAPVAWHIDHSLRVIIKTVSAMEESDQMKYQKKFSFRKSLVFLSGKIPRGKARSPSVVLPPDNLNIEDLELQISLARHHVEKMDSLPQKAYFDHPYFSHLKKKEAIRFLVIHTEHHLKIIRDILKA